MKYIRTKDGRIIDTNLISIGNSETDFRSLEHYLEVSEQIIIKQADTIEELIQPGDIIFYFDFHSQKEQCMYLNYILGIEDVNIIKLLVPVEDDYKCVAKAYHEITELSGMKHVTKKGSLQVI